jgi:hypothetical protein
MMPQFTINYLALGACVLSAMLLGFLWFGPIFGKAWAKRMGLEQMKPPGPAAMVRALLLYALGSLLIAWVLAHGIAVWRPSSWNAGAVDAADWIYGLNGAGWTWLGFFVPLQLGRVAFEQRTWGLVAINAGYDLFRLLVFGMILAHWR